MTAIGSTWGSESSKKPQQRGIIRRTRDSAFDAGGETEGLGHFEDSERCGDSGYLKYRILRTLTAQCVLLRSVRSSPIGNNMLTIRTFLFSPPSLASAAACTANSCVFFFYRPTGDRGAFHCRWKAVATQSIGLVPFPARGILPVAEERSTLSKVLWLPRVFLALRVGSISMSRAVV